MNTPLFEKGQRVFYSYSVRDRVKQQGYGTVVGIKPFRDAHVYKVERNDGEGCPWLTAAEVEST